MQERMSKLSISYFQVQLLTICILYTVDLVIFECLNFREFFILRLFHEN